MQDYFFDLTIIVVCSACLAWLASLCRQPLIIGYLVCGILIGPWGLGLIRHAEVVENISHIGVTLLLFLAGLVLHPQRLTQLFRNASLVTLGGGAISLIFTFGFLRIWGYSYSASLIAAFALMFSSTILVVKLLPTTTLHHKHMGAVSIAILVAQDIMAVMLILFIRVQAKGSLWGFIGALHVKALLLAIFVFGFEQIILRRMMRKADKYHEILVMLCLAWCLGIAVLAKKSGFSYEVGAFIAGIAMARSKIAIFLSEKLKLLRDFFLMFFFFVLGAELDLFLAKSIWLPALILSVLILVFRPLYFRWLFRLMGEESKFSKELGIRFGQASEFSLLVAIIAAKTQTIPLELSQLIQLTTILTMMVSAYVIVLKCPSPLAIRPELQQD